MPDILGITVKNNERAEPLDGEHSILQPVDGYRFGSDAIALSKFASHYIKRGRKTADLCSGSGVIGISLAIEKDIKVVGAEIDADLCDMSNRSCALNGLESVRFINADVKDLPRSYFAKNSFDAAVCNPPYYKSDSKASIVAPNANCEITVEFEDIVRAANDILVSGGGFYIVHVCSRLDDVIYTCRKYGLMPKQLVVNTNGKTFLLRCVKGGKQSMTAYIKEF